MSINWPPASYKQRLLDLDEIIKALRTLPSDIDDAVETSLTRYLVIRSAGFIEATRDDVADEFSKIQASVEVSNRIRTHLRKGQGAAPSQLLDFVKSYSVLWHENLSQFLKLDDSILKSDIGALVAARKKIAHGDGDQVTASRALRWAESSKSIAIWFVNRFNPSLRPDESLEPNSNGEIKTYQLKRQDA